MKEGSEAEGRRRKARRAGGCGQRVAHQVVVGETNRDSKAQEQPEGVMTVWREQWTGDLPESNVHTTRIMHMYVTKIHQIK